MMICQAYTLYCRISVLFQVMIARLAPAARVSYRSLPLRARSVRMAAVSAPAAVSTEYSALCKKLKEISALNGALAIPLCRATSVHRS